MGKEIGKSIDHRIWRIKFLWGIQHFHSSTVDKRQVHEKVELIFHSYQIDSTCSILIVELHWLLLIQFGGQICSVVNKNSIKHEDNWIFFSCQSFVCSDSISVIEYLFIILFDNELFFSWRFVRWWWWWSSSFFAKRNVCLITMPTWYDNTISFSSVCFALLSSSYIFQEQWWLIEGQMPVDTWRHFYCSYIDLMVIINGDRVHVDDDDKNRTIYDAIRDEYSWLMLFFFSSTQSIEQMSS